MKTHEKTHLGGKNNGVRKKLMRKTGGGYQGIENFEK